MMNCFAWRGPFLGVLGLMAIFGLDMDRQSLWAQGNVGAGKNDLRVIDFQGKIDGYEQGVIFVSNEKGEKKVVVLPDDVEKIRFIAEALPEWVQQGAFVRFAAEFRADGMPTQPISEMEVFTLNARRRRPFSPEEMQRNVPGIYPIGVGKGTNLADDAANSNTNNGNQQAATQKFNVVGVIIGLDPTAVGLQCGDRTMKLPLGEKCKFKLSANGLDFATIGDSVSVKGLFSPQATDRIQSDSIVVTAAKPLGSVSDDNSQAGKSKPTKAKNSRKNKGKTSKKEDDSQ